MAPTPKQRRSGWHEQEITVQGNRLTTSIVRWLIHHSVPFLGGSMRKTEDSELGVVATDGRVPTMDTDDGRTEIAS